MSRHSKLLKHSHISANFAGLSIATILVSSVVALPASASLQTSSLTTAQTMPTATLHTEESSESAKQTSASSRQVLSPTVTRIASFNIRCQCTEKNPVNVWDSGNRRQRTTQQILATGAQIIGLQETYGTQVGDLFGRNGQPGMLGGQWKSFTSTAPEALNAIGWDSRYFDAIDGGFRYLTTGPAAANGSSRAYERTVTWALLRSRSTQQTMYVFNTHLEHRNKSEMSVTGQTYGQIRALQAQEVLATMRSINSQNLPMMLTGDFNANQLDDPFRIINTSGSVVDSKSAASALSNESISTFNGYSPAKPGNRIDFVFASKGISVTNYTVFAQYVNGLFASDHFPVVANLSIPRLNLPGTARVFKVPANDTLYAVTGSGALTRATALTFDQWRALGFPKPNLAPATYVKYAWADDIYMVNFWDANPNSWTWTRLDLRQWRQAGFPKPYLAGWIQGTDLVKYGTSDQIFANLNGNTKAISWDEWKGMQFKPFANRSSAGFVKTRYSDTVYSVNDLRAMKGVPIDFNRWMQLGFPSPMQVSSVRY